MRSLVRRLPVELAAPLGDDSRAWPVDRSRHRAPLGVEAIAGDGLVISASQKSGRLQVAHGRDLIATEPLRSPI